jgi:predicted O-linked N-acetylglucosamine transferase (SPINDLY family)
MDQARIDQHWARAKQAVQDQDFRTAKEACLAVLEARPDHARALNFLGLSRIALGDLAAGAEHLRQSVRLESGNAFLWLNVGAGLLRTGDIPEAFEAFREAEARKAFDPAKVGQATCLVEMSRFAEALAATEALAQTSAYYPTACRIKATVLCELGRAAEANQLLLPLAWGDPTLDDVRLFALQNDPGFTAADSLQAHRAWGSRFPPRPAPAIQDPRTDRPLNIGFVSPDFREHSCAYFLEGLWAHRDPNQVRLFAYAEVPIADARTQVFERRSDGWRTTHAMADGTLAEQIRSDRIDILVDLAGHTHGNRLSVFALRPAPLQLTWLGYPATTGMAVFDGRLTDAEADPPEAPTYATEPLLRLPNFLCYTPPADAPLPAAPPSVSGQPLTFGCFNAPAKINARVLDLWARLLREVPGSRLLLKGKSFHEPFATTHFREGFRSRGIDAGRISFMGWVPRGQSPLSTYHQLDLALDPFPYNGTTTTCEAVWMGVPVITLAGDRHAGRVGRSLLTAAGLTDWIARDEDDYLRIAVELATGPAALAEARRDLRARVAATPLLDGPGFARNMEDLFRRLWVGAVAASGKA